MGRSLKIWMSFAASALLLSSAPALLADGVAGANVLQNPGFEDWSVASGLGDPPALTNAGLVPTNWVASPEDQAPKDNPGTFTGGIYKDASVKHGGNASLRLESGRSVDIIGVTQEASVDPNSKYEIDAWYKGDGIAANGDTGVFVWAVYGPVADYWSHMTFNSNKPPVHDGTFDWTPFQMTFDTNDTAGKVRLTLQLRLASGKVWFDDVVLKKLGTVTPVKSY